MRLQRCLAAMRGLQCTSAGCCSRTAGGGARGVLMSGPGSARGWRRSGDCDDQAGGRRIDDLWIVLRNGERRSRKYLGLRGNKSGFQRAFYLCEPTSRFLLQICAVFGGDRQLDNDRMGP